MKKIGLGILVLGVLIGITVYVTQQESRSTMTGELVDFAIEDTAAIDQIVLKDEMGTVVKLDRAQGHWVLNDTFKARPDAVRNLLHTMKKLSVRAPISQQQMNTVLKSIISNHTLVSVYDDETLIKSYYVGGPDRDHSGTYMLMKESQRPFLMHIEGFHGFLTPRYFTNPLEWRDRGIYELKEADIARIELDFPQEPNQDVLIERDETGAWQVFAGAENELVNAVDSFMLSAYLANYEMIHYESYEETKDAAFMDSVRTSEPIFRISVHTADGTQRSVTGFRKPLKEGYDPEGNPIDYDLDRLYVMIDSGEIVIGQYAIFDKITKGIRFFKNR